MVSGHFSECLFSNEFFPRAFFRMTRLRIWQTIFLFVSSIFFFFWREGLNFRLRNVRQWQAGEAVWNSSQVGVSLDRGYLDWGEV